MNQFLVDALRNLNAALAVVIVVVMTVAGLASGHFLGVIIGPIVGCVLAILVCGGLAIAVQIEARLRAIEELLRSRPLR